MLHLDIMKLLMNFFDELVTVVFVLQYVDNIHNTVIVILPFVAYTLVHFKVFRIYNCPSEVLILIQYFK